MSVIGLPTSEEMTFMSRSDSGVNRRVAHVNSDAVLDAIGAKAAFARQVDQPLVGGHQPQVASASGVGGIRQMIAENGDDGEKCIGDGAVQLARDWRLRDEDDGVGQRGAPGARGEPKDQNCRSERN